MLSDDEKKKIEAEEAYRHQVRQRLQNPGSNPAAPAANPASSPDQGPEETLYQESPAMSAEPLKLYGSLILSLALIVVSVVVQLWMFAVPVIVLLEAGILVPWWVQTRSTRLTITDRKTILERGWLSKSRTEVFHDDVRTVEVHQSLLHRMTGHGTFQISSAGESDWEIQVHDMPRVQDARELVQKYRKK